MEKVKFYSAYVRTDVDESFLFELEELRIKQLYKDGTIELDAPYFVSDNYSTRYFGGRSGNTVDCEYKLRHGCVFYSSDNHKCMDYLLAKMHELSDYCDKVCSRLQESRITKKFLEDK